MDLRRSQSPWVATALALLGCGSEPPVSIDVDGSVDASPGDGAAAEAAPADAPAHDAAPSTEAGDAGEAPPVLDAETRNALRAIAFGAAPPALPADATNAWADDAGAASLGQRFFFDPGFSGPLLDADNDGGPNALGRRGETGRVACAGCHVPAAGFSDTRSTFQELSLAAGWTTRRTPSLLDVGHARLLNWGGRRDTLYNQAIAALESPLEMNGARLFLAQEIHRRYRAAYEAVFGPMPPLDDAERFPPLEPTNAGCTLLDPSVEHPRVHSGDMYECHGKPGDGAEFDGMREEDREAVTRVAVNWGKALGAYQRLLGCGPARFDAWVAGDAEALSPSEQRGAVLFVGRGDCVRCHGGPFLTDFRHHNVGMRATPVVGELFLHADDRGAAADLPLALEDPLSSRGAFSDGDDGRLSVPIGADLEGAFRTPSLRCVALRPSFMHTGQMGTLREVIGFFDRGGDTSGFVGTGELHPLGLSSAERADLEAFLRALTGDGPHPDLIAAPRR